MAETWKLIHGDVASYEAVMLDGIQVVLDWRSPMVFSWITRLLRRMEQLASQRLIVRCILSKNKLPEYRRTAVAIVHVEVLGQVLRAVVVVRSWKGLSDRIDKTFCAITAEGDSLVTTQPNALK